MTESIIKAIEEIDDLDEFRLAKDARELTDGEAREIESVFGKSLDRSKIRVNRGHILLIFAEAMTLKNTLFFQKDVYEPDFSLNVSMMSLLAHECCHAWQYQNKVKKYHWTKALAEHIKHGDETYNYSLDPTKALTDYRFEQMGQIVQDYYWAKKLGSPVHEFEAVIYRSIEL